MNLQEKSTVKAKEVYRDEFVSLQILVDGRVALCTATSEYIPIEHFKKAFLEIGSILQAKNIKALIFDKRQLNTFHQPSMEWYYTEWKADMLDHGLVKHYKILPSMPWFAKSVEAGKRDIERNHPSFDFDTFSVTYVNSVEEAISDYQGDQ